MNSILPLDLAPLCDQNAARHRRATSLFTLGMATRQLSVTHSHTLTTCAFSIESIASSTDVRVQHRAASSSIGLSLSSVPLLLTYTIAVLHAWKGYGHLSALWAQYSLGEVNSPCSRNKAFGYHDYYKSLGSSHCSVHVTEALLLITNLSARGQRSPFTKLSSVRNLKSSWQRAQVLSR